MSTSLPELYLAVWGPAVVGVVLACLAQGYLTAVIVSYLTSHFCKDRWINRAVVLLIFCLTWTDTILATTKLGYQSTTYRYDIPYTFDWSLPISFVAIICTYFTIFTCQAFMSWRCFSFAWGMRTVYGGPARWGIMGCTALLAILNVVCLVGSVMVPVSIAKATDLYEIILSGQDTDGHVAHIYFWYLYTFSSYLAIDALITILMTTQFRSARTGFGESDSILQAIINLTLRNGALVTLCQIATLVIVKIATNWVLTPITVISRIYALTILAILVAPRKAQEQYREKQDTEARLSSGFGPQTNLSASIGLTSSGNGKIQCISCGSTGLSGHSADKGFKRHGGTVRNQQQPVLEVKLGTPELRGVPGSAVEHDRAITFRAALLGLDEESETDDVSMKGKEAGMEGTGVLEDEDEKVRSVL